MTFVLPLCAAGMCDNQGCKRMLALRPGHAMQMQCHNVYAAAARHTIPSWELSNPKPAGRPLIMQLQSSTKLDLKFLKLRATPGAPRPLAGPLGLSSGRRPTVS